MAGTGFSCSVVSDQCSEERASRCGAGILATPRRRSGAPSAATQGGFLSGILGDISNNLAPLEVFPCRIADGQLWISLG
jgi:hypothetical protein